MEIPIFQASLPKYIYSTCGNCGSIVRSYVRKSHPVGPLPGMCVVCGSVVETQLPCTEIIQRQSTGEKEYRRNLRAAVRGLWLGVLDLNQFWDSMDFTVRNGLDKAWNEGARECGILPDERTPAERIQLTQRINYELQWVTRLGEFVEQNNKTNGGKLAPLFQRVDVWAGRYNGVVSEARTLACADRKTEWILGDAEEHCSSCSRLDGKVKRGSFWHGKGILPRIHDAWYLECKGFRCTCQLVPTDKPLSRGPLPKLP